MAKRHPEFNAEQDPNGQTRHIHIPPMSEMVDPFLTEADFEEPVELTVPGVLTSERDGNLWWNSIVASEERIGIWLAQLEQAEIAGGIEYDLIISQLRVPFWAEYHCLRIAQQERMHASLVKSIRAYYPCETIYHLNFDEDFMGLALSEKRGLMRMDTIASHPATPARIANMANRILDDETYHVWFTQKLLSECGNLRIPEYK